MAKEIDEAKKNVENDEKTVKELAAIIGKDLSERLKALVKVVL